MSAPGDLALTDAQSGVLCYHAFGWHYRARADSDAEAVLWSAEGLLHNAAEYRRRHDARKADAPEGIPSLLAIAECWEARARRMVALAKGLDGYLGSVQGVGQ